MVALAASNRQNLQELQEKLSRLNSRVVGTGPIRRYLQSKLRELEAERVLYERRATR